MKQFNEKVEKLLSLIQHEKKMHIYWETNICSKSDLIDTDLQNQNFYQLSISLLLQTNLLQCQQELMK